MLVNAASAGSVVEKSARSTGRVEYANAFELCLVSVCHESCGNSVFAPIVVKDMFDQKRCKPVRRVVLAKGLAIAFAHEALVEWTQHIAASSAPFVSVNVVH